MVRKQLVSSAAAFALFTIIASPYAFAAGEESQFTSLINQERASRGIPTLAVRSDLVAVARRHSERMAASGSIWHNPNLAGEVRDWQKVAENVGRGADVASIHRAFMDSNEHRINVLWTEVTEVGVGVARAGGKLYVTQVFRLPSGATATRSAVSEPSAPSPAPSTTASRAPRPAAKPEPKPRAVAILVELTSIDDAPL
jgi:uncharacterized protein YkwD